jgi:hypothetical protein
MLTRLGVVAAMGAAVCAFAAPANAVITTFAAYNAVGLGSNVYWKNDGTTAANGTGGSIYTISSSASTVPGTARISFSFLDPVLQPFFTDVAADYTLLANVTNTPASTIAGYKIEPGISGGFSIKTASAITANGVTYAPGANLLSGTFDDGILFGRTNSTSGSFSSATTSGATITYTSDFLTFQPTLDRDFSLALTSMTPSLQSQVGAALRTFRAVSTGSFSSDPAPAVSIGVPEAGTWAMFLGGFGVIGFTARRRRKNPEQYLQAW